MRLLVPVLLCGLCLAFPMDAQEIMPLPAKMVRGKGRLPYAGPLGAHYEGYRSARLENAFQRWAVRMGERTGLVSYEPDSTPVTVIVVQVERKGDHLLVGEDEGYKLQIDTAGVRISAGTDLGALHAMATLYQLLQQDAMGWHFPQVTITDAPRFPWRGLLMDVCRHFMPREVILRELDGLELVKMNVLHLHLTEDQGFRIESRTFPELHGKGSDGQFLSQDDIRVILREADRRGIRVIPEFDLPGHATSWFVSHPELASAPGPYQVETRFGVFDPTFDPTKEATYAFLDAFLGEMAALFPDPYMHIGGDENSGKQWDANPAIQAFMKEHALADNHALQAYFNTRLHAILKKHGKRMIGWDEIGEGELPDDITIQSWRGREGLVKAAQQGRDVILSNGWYIDLCQPAGYHYLNDPLPPDSPLSPEERKHVLGGEATMWAELVDARNVDTRIWPRTAAIAERLWSPAEVNDVSDMYARSATISHHLDFIGLRHKSAQLELVRSIAGNDELARQLLPLVQVLAPVEGYRRHAIAEHTTRTPLTNLADAAVPDPFLARGNTRTMDLLVQGGVSVFDGIDPITDELLPGLSQQHVELLTRRNEMVAAAYEAYYALRGLKPMEAERCVHYQELIGAEETAHREFVMADLAAFKRLIDAACKEKE